MQLSTGKLHACINRQLLCVCQKARVLRTLPVASLRARHRSHLFQGQAAAGWPSPYSLRCCSAAWLQSRYLQLPAEFTSEAQVLLEHVQARSHMLLGAGLTDTAAEKASPPNVLPVLQVHEVVWQLTCLHVRLAAAGCTRWTPACCEVSLLL